MVVVHVHAHVALTAVMGRRRLVYFARPAQLQVVGERALLCWACDKGRRSRGKRQRVAKERANELYLCAPCAVRYYRYINSPLKVFTRTLSWTFFVIWRDEETFISEAAAMRSGLPFVDKSVGGFLITIPGSHEDTM